MPSLDRDGNVFVLNLGDNENRFNPDWVGSVNALLDEVASTDGPRAVVLSASGKTWSQGLDLEWFAANVDQVPEFIPEVHELYARLLEFPAPTVAAIQGHCYAAGAMLSLAVDERYMREDRGYWCLPEADINIPFTHGMDALIKSRLRPQVANSAMVFAQRFGAPDAVAAEIVDRAVAEDELLPAAIARGAELSAKNGDTVSAIRKRLYAPAIAALRDRDANAIPGLGS